MTIIEPHFYPQIVAIGFSESAATFAISAYRLATMADPMIIGMLISRFRIRSLWFGPRPVIIAAFLLLPKTAATVYGFVILLRLIALLPYYQSSGSPNDCSTHRS